jgi:predicted amidophosphoribosyltransferase
MVADTKYLKSQDDGEVICLICQSTIEPNDPKSICPSCNRPYHSECWEQNKGCAVYGCPKVPPTEPLNELEIPVSYWGKEKKTCPSCGGEILAAALRCSHCGVIFSSARPATWEEYQEEQQLKEEKAFYIQYFDIHRTAWRITRFFLV